MSFAFEISIIVLLVLLNGWFAMSEFAVVSARRARLAARAADGSKGARVALKLAENPARFLSSVQIGITLVGILAGAFSGATLAEKLAAWIAAQLPALAAASHAIAIALIVGAITYASLIVGELVPKQIALANREGVAAFVARPMAAMARVASPLLWVLEHSSRLVLKLLGVSRADGDSVTEDEVKAMIAEGTRTGVFEPREKELMLGAMRFGDRKVRAVMTPHHDVVSLDLTWEAERLLGAVRASHHSRYPVYRGDPHEVIGVLQVKDLLDLVIEGNHLDAASAVKPIEVVPDHVPALQVLEILKRSSIHMALVVDEYGSVEGIVTATDILSAISGTFHEHGQDSQGSIVRRGDGSWLVDGDVAADLVAESLHCRAMAEGDEDYATLAGFVLARMRRIPSAGEHFEEDGWRFEVVDMDGRRIDKVLVSRVEEGDSWDRAGSSDEP